MILSYFPPDIKSKTKRVSIICNYCHAQKIDLIPLGDYLKNNYAGYAESRGWKSIIVPDPSYAVGNKLVEYHICTDCSRKNLSESFFVAWIIM